VSYDTIATTYVTKHDGTTTSQVVVATEEVSTTRPEDTNEFE
jgi:hypothetical protein